MANTQSITGQKRNHTEIDSNNPSTNPSLKRTKIENGTALENRAANSANTHDIEESKNLIQMEVEVSTEQTILENFPEELFFIIFEFLTDPTNTNFYLYSCNFSKTAKFIYNHFLKFLPQKANDFYRKPNDIDESEFKQLSERTPDPAIPTIIYHNFLNYQTRKWLSIDFEDNNWHKIQDQFNLNNLRIFIDIFKNIEIFNTLLPNNISIQKMYIKCILSRSFLKIHYYTKQYYDDDEDQEDNIILVDNFLKSIFNFPKNNAGINVAFQIFLYVVECALNKEINASKGDTHYIIENYRVIDFLKSFLCLSCKNEYKKVVFKKIIIPYMFKLDFLLKSVFLNEYDFFAEIIEIMGNRENGAFEEEFSESFDMFINFIQYEIQINANFYAVLFFLYYYCLLFNLNKIELKKWKVVFNAYINNPNRYIFPPMQNPISSLNIIKTTKLYENDLIESLCTKPWINKIIDEDKVQSLIIFLKEMKERAGMFYKYFQEYKPFQIVEIKLSTVYLK